MSPAGAKRSEKIEADITCQASREKHEAVVPAHAPIIKQQAAGTDSQLVLHPPPLRAAVDHGGGVLLSNKSSLQNQSIVPKKLVGFSMARTM